MILFLSPCLFADSAQKTSLEALLLRALKENFDIHISESTAHQSYFDIKAKKSVFDWTLDGDFSYKDDKDEAVAAALAASRSTQSTYGLGLSKRFLWGTLLELKLNHIKTKSNFAGLAHNPYWDLTYSFGLTHPVLENFFGFSDRNAVQVAELTSQSQDLNEFRNIEVVLSNVEKAYWVLIYSYQNVEIKKQALEKARKLLTSHEKKIKSGLIEETELLASEANVATRQSDLLLVQKELISSDAAFQKFFKRSQKFTFEPDEEFVYEKKTLDLDVGMAQAFQKRYDYLSVLENAKAQDLNLSVQSNKKLPKLDLIATLISNGLEGQFQNSQDEAMRWQHPTYVVGFNISVPLNNRLDHSNFLKAQAEKQKTLYQLKKTEQNVYFEVKESYEALKKYEKIVANSFKVEKLQTQKLELEEKKFNQGRSSLDLVIDYQEDLLAAQTNKLQSILQYKEAYINWQLAQGVFVKDHTIDLKFKR
ncbi:MAG: TolC family protein [Deltaproteobacteria bacterium]|nr:TolC family protein [Deltaproteobacteria bacterium]